MSDKISRRNTDKEVKMSNEDREIIHQQTTMDILYNNSFYIMRSGKVQPHSMHGHHYHNTFELYYLYSGDRYYFIKNRTYHVKRGCLVLIKPYDIHSTSNYGDAMYDRCLMNVKNSFMREVADMARETDIYELFDRDVVVVQLNFQEQSLVETLLVAMAQEYKVESSGHMDFIKASLLQIMLIAHRHLDDEIATTTEQSSVKHKTVSEIAAYINNNFNREITLAEISERFFISPCYFSRIFKSITGISFSEYLSGVRIKEAERLLAKTEMSVSEIAEAVGFNNITHFGRCFKSSTGMSPLAYRRTRKNGG